MDEPRWLTAELFAGREGQPFEVGEPGGPTLTVELVAVRQSSEPGGRSPDGQQRRQFSLDFRGPREPVLPQSTYAFAHDELGPLLLFLVPQGQDEDGTTYEAAFA
ncbi:MAG TPA: hypothetical protein VFT70_05135 [Nocardioides sp.]|nr:hypothetical protein [Nocardioides sp.]